LNKRSFFGRSGRDARDCVALLLEQLEHALGADQVRCTDGDETAALGVQLGLIDRVLPAAKHRE
jgi:hypothetical protein